MYYQFKSNNYLTLPERIRLPDGSTRTSLDELSQEELLELGIEFVDGDYSEPLVVSEPLTHKQFMDRFTDIELAGIMTAAKNSIELELWFKRFELAQDIRVDDPQTINGVNALEVLGLIDQGRAIEILKI